MKKHQIYLMYHAIEDKFASSTYDYEFFDKEYTVSYNLFKDHMEYLAKEISNSQGGKEIYITFDDGHKSNFTNALPILKHYNLKAIFFVTTDFIGCDGFMNWDDLNVLISNGMEIGSHSKSHRDFRNLSKIEIKTEISTSKSILEKQLGVNVNKFSCPGGFYNKTISESARYHGYSEVYTSRIGIRKSNQSFLIPRVCIRSTYEVSDLEKIIHGNKFYWAKLVTIQCFKAIGKSILPYHFYGWLSRFIRRI